MVSAQAYDKNGRKPRKYLFFAASGYGGNSAVSDGGFKLNPFQQQQDFYSNSANQLYGQGETYFYSKTEFEESPLNRVLRSYAPGSNWVNAGKGHSGWLCTYYRYDVVNLLRAVIQLVGIQLLQANSWSINELSGDILNEQCFRYEYDGKRRMNMKKVPGAGSVYMGYDSINRPLATGLWTNSSSHHVGQTYRELTRTFYDDFN
jgi:hypothetical protein